jgi:hypothetical protein
VEKMYLPAIQYRLLKSRAEARFSELGKRKLWPAESLVRLWENCCRLTRLPKHRSIFYDCSISRVTPHRALFL